MTDTKEYPPALSPLVVPDGGTVLRYGPAPEQFGELWTAKGGPVVVLIHGGFWLRRYRLDLMHALAADLQRHGCTVWNLEYRRVGDAGGGWPGTFSDIAAGFDILPDLAAEHGADLSRVVVVGHSAGGHLALWLAARAKLPAVPGANPRLLPQLVFALAPVADLVLAGRLELGRNATAKLLGCMYHEDLTRYRHASPAAQLPIGCRQIIAHGTADALVPFDMSVRFCAAANAAGDECELIGLPGVGHFPLINPASPAWEVLRRRLLTEIGLSSAQ